MNKSYPRTLEHRRNMSIAIKEALSKKPIGWNLGENNSFYGKKHKEESTLKMSESQIKYFKEHPEEAKERAKSRIGIKRDRKIIEKQKLGMKRAYQRIHDEAQKLQQEGFQVIPIAEVIPDIIAIKDGKTFAVEVEYGKPNYKKYEVNDYGKYFDDIIWLIRK